ncbi:VOC family protein [Aliiroseovarius sp. 2305UL8-7]|uniref:VOC family protein n=1 Tax=Aliiroseovarius conchicola TaxID=3121637 RepID=UPI0035285A47
MLAQIHHVQLAMPNGQEDRATPFYLDVLGMDVEPKPPVLAKRGGIWFRKGAIRLHLGVETPFRPAKKAHPAFQVEGLDDLAQGLAAASFVVNWDTDLDGYRRFYSEDPFGNRIEFLEPA